MYSQKISSDYQKNTNQTYNHISTGKFHLFFLCRFGLHPYDLESLLLPSHHRQSIYDCFCYKHKHQSTPKTFNKQQKSSSPPPHLLNQPHPYHTDLGHQGIQKIPGPKLNRMHF